MTGTDLCVNSICRQYISVPVIFEPPSIYLMMALCDRNIPLNLHERETKW
jgi:hypothetical protein